jgi:6-phosphogluconolactonase (cycloisomerase 2 family)
VAPPEETPVNDYFAYVGCFTTPQRGARGDGIHAFRIAHATGQWTEIQHIGGLTNPSFLEIEPRTRRLYAVHGDESYATAFALDAKSGQATILGRAATGGGNGVRQAIDPAGRFLIVANYAGGNIGALPIEPDGSLTDVRQILPLEGTPGPHPKEQTSAHPHDVLFAPGGRFVLVPDKGLDRIFVFHFDPKSGWMAPGWSIPAAAGAGPRHAAFSPSGRTLWVLNELDSTVATYPWEGRGPATQVLSTRPPGAANTSSAAAEIAVAADGRFVYCSNRGDDSIAMFAAEKDGTLRPLGWHPSGGLGPRFIALDPLGHRLYAANEQSHSVIGFPVDPATGLLGAPIQSVPVLSPCTIAFFRPPG